MQNHTRPTLGQENLLRMMRWIWWHCPPDKWFEIRALAVWGRARYLSVTEAPHDIVFFCEWAGKKHFVPLKLEGQSGVRTRDLRLPKPSALITAPGPPPIAYWRSLDKKAATIPALETYLTYRYLSLFYPVLIYTWVKWSTQWWSDTAFNQPCSNVEMGETCYFRWKSAPSGYWTRSTRSGCCHVLNILPRRSIRWRRFPPANISHLVSSPSSHHPSPGLVWPKIPFISFQTIICVTIM